MIDSAEALPWKLRKRVLPQHTDHAGVMWHGAYINWLEEARIDALDQVGLPYSELSADGYEMPVVSIEIKYLRSLKHGEEVVLESICMPPQGVRWQWRTTFLRNGRELVAEARVQLVLIMNSIEGHRLLRKVPPRLEKALFELQLGQDND